MPEYITGMFLSGNREVFYSNDPYVTQKELRKGSLLFWARSGGYYATMQFPEALNNEEYRPYVANQLFKIINKHNAETNKSTNSQR